MEYLYYKSAKGNFGDDLNGWLWPKLFGEEDLSDERAFLGIGTILYEENKHIIAAKDKKKVVFGTGVRPVHKQFPLDEQWDVRFLRGPLSSNHFNRQFKYISDAAYALKLLPEFEKICRITKKYKVSFIPYFKSESYFDWPAICKELGIHYITTHTDKGIEFTLREIAASQFIISEAMHGAILADIFRIPWKRFVLTTPYTEGERISEFKWTDWMNSLDIYRHDPLYLPLYKKGRFHEMVKRLTGGTVEASLLQKSKVRDQILHSLSQSDLDYELSSDQRANEIFSALNEEVERLQATLFKAVY
ncbi:polysaccharide pyruvyl transferase [Echinicola strongylocentroti]|uniref:Polysaccharide pyruvyl transferase n=1 Tax=Echinicola strongylocentroti TaxID=1795355 RepID=A0A2Z4IDG4_9BACT|nr:polysaccharide pyruvyl transferase family protein [Echinicola strongylocentroti]AWW29062.1 polysaccharide pyruvyl transferase [Echinicola strongylocentroti]